MQSIIIVSKNQEKVREEIKKISSLEKVNPIDEDINNFEKAVGIQDIIEIQKRLFLKPIKSPIKIILINTTNSLTTQAQNSLLKILEEPPENTLIIITIDNKNSLLPTVISRCKIIEIKEKNKLDKDDLQEFMQILNALPTYGAGDRLKLAQDISKTKEDTESWLEKMVNAAREKLIKNPNDLNVFKILEELQKTYEVIKSTNATPRLTLENLLLNI